MNGIDTARIAVIKKKLMEAERRIYEANRIMSNVGMPTESAPERGPSGLYPGQYADPTTSAECLE